MFGFLFKTVEKKSGVHPTSRLQMHPSNAQILRWFFSAPKLEILGPGQEFPEHYFSPTIATKQNSAQKHIALQVRLDVSGVIPGMLSNGEGFSVGNDLILCPKCSPGCHWTYLFNWFKNLHFRLLYDKFLRYCLIMFQLRRHIDRLISWAGIYD